MARAVYRVDNSCLAELAITSYFGSAFLNFIRPVPFGHLVNAVFLVVFMALALMGRQNRVRPIHGAGPLAGMGLLVVLSAVAWVLRDDWDVGDLVRTLTWLTPAALLVLVTVVDGIRHRLVCRVVAGISLIVNFAVLILVGEFNASLGKFEVNVPWLAISSNELSFHLVAFGSLFLLLLPPPEGQRIGLLTAIVSLIHLSKAHLGALVAAPVLGAMRRHLLRALAIAGLGLLAIQWLATSETAGTIQGPEGFQRVFNPLRDLAVLLSGFLLGDGIGDLERLAMAVGLYRFEVYQEAADLLAYSPFGHPRAVVDAALRGLDPHSNILYLALREGWIVTGAYVAFMGWLLARLPSRTVRDRAVYALVFYVLIRCLFLTFDPVKIAALAFYAGFLLRPEAAGHLRRLQAGGQPGPLPAVEATGHA